MIHKTIIYSVWIVCLIIISPCFGNDSKVQLSSEEKIWLNQEHTVRVRIGSAPPFMLTDGKIRGMAIDYLTYIFNQHGIKIQYIQEFEVTWPQALKHIENHDVVDMVPTAKITDERKKRMIFSDEYIFAPWVIFTRSKAGFIGSLEDLKGKTVSVEEGYVIHEKLKRDYPEIKLKIVSAKLPNYAEIPVSDLSSGLVDAYIGNLIMTTYMIQSKGYTNIKVAAPTPFGNHNQAMAMRSDWPELASIINKTLVSMTPDEHANILNRWLSIRYEYGINKTDVIKWVLGIAGIAVLFILTVLIWNRKLKSEVVFRKNMQLHIQEKDKALRLSLDAAKAGTWTWDINTGEVIWDDQMQKIFGLTPGTFDSTFDAWKKRVHPDDLQAAEKATVDALEHEKGYEHEYRVKGTSGEWRIINAQAATLRDDKGKPIRMSGFAMDITKRKLVEVLLKESKEYLANIINTIGDPVFVKDEQFRFVLVNDALCKFLGKTRDELVETTGMEFLPKDQMNHFLEVDRKVLSSGEDKLNEESLTAGDNTIRTIVTKKTRYIDAQGAKFIVGVIRDITEGKRADEERATLEIRLQQAQKMESIGILAGGIAHDFNNILYPIIGFTELSIQELPKEHQVQENLQDILDGAKRARDLVKQILQFSRQEKQTLQPTVLQPVVEEVIKLLKTTIPANIDIQCHLYNGEDYVLCDSTEIHEIVMNLCTNAYHSMEKNGGIIIVRLNKQNPSPDLNLPSGEYICLSVSDNGVGIPEGIIDKIFEPYLTTKEIGKGSGLGLSVVHGIVTNYKGNISVESSSGKGSDFDVFLPITTQSRIVEQKLIKDKSLGGTENILFVDDEASIVKLATRILEPLGYTITGKTSCTEALELFEEKPDGFDLVITDMAMPIMTGTEFAKKVLKIQPDIPIIICTGFSENVDSKIAKSIGIKEYIKKPILLDDLTSKIRKVLDQSSKG